MKSIILFSFILHLINYKWSNSNNIYRIQPSLPASTLTILVRTSHLDFCRNLMVFLLPSVSPTYFSNQWAKRAHSNVKIMFILDSKPSNGFPSHNKTQTSHQSLPGSRQRDPGYPLNTAPITLLFANPFLLTWEMLLFLKSARHSYLRIFALAVPSACDLAPIFSWIVFHDVLISIQILPLQKELPWPPELK